MHDAHLLFHSLFLGNMLCRRLTVLRRCGVVPKIAFDDTLALLVTETNSLVITGCPMPIPGCRWLIR